MAHSRKFMRVARHIPKKRALRRGLICLWLLLTAASLGCPMFCEETPAQTINALAASRRGERASGSLNNREQ